MALILMIQEIKLSRILIKKDFLLNPFISSVGALWIRFLSGSFGRLGYPQRIKVFLWLVKKNSLTKRKPKNRNWKGTLIVSGVVVWKPRNTFSSIARSHLSLGG
jgi:hypothetical protein